MKCPKQFIWILVIAISSLLTSCSDYLDKAPEEDLTIEEAFRDRKYADAFLMGAYSDLPFEYMFVDQADINPFVLASDELNVCWPEKFGKLMNRGAMNPYNATGRLWINMYEGIRKANLFLQYIHLTEFDKISLKRTRMCGLEKRSFYVLFIISISCVHMVLVSFLIMY